jgi:N-acetylglucosaminyl-diphospho-decaprenol L-rhamnosyltransferase
MNKDITVILLAHKSGNLVMKFIKNIYNKFQIIIIDNSNDLSLKKKIEKFYPNINFKMIKNDGYGSAINYASTFVKTEYFLISNPDIEGLTETNINEFYKSAKILKDKFSSLGPRYINANPKSHVQSDERIEIADMKFISGACMFFKTETFKSLEGFDENFFLYFEESDFCLRSYKINKNYQINRIRINHYVGTSVNTKNENEKKLLEKLYTWHFIWSKYYYYKKNYGIIYSIIYFIPTLLRILFRILFYTLTKNYEKQEKFINRFNGLITSMKGLKSYKRLK